MRNTHTFVDAHAHLHGSFDTGKALRCALDQFRKQASRQQIEPQQWCGCLMVSALDATSPVASAQRFLATLKDFTARPCDEPGSVSLVSPDSEESLDIVFGNQLVTKEGLEVLTYGHREPVSSGDSLEATVQSGLAVDALMILPWGFGKWLGKRGEAIGTLLTDSRLAVDATHQLFVGDSAARLNLSRIPAMLLQSAEMGIRNLPGSDPLPFKDEHRKTAMRGFELVAPMDHARPLASIRHALETSNSQPRVYGRGESLPGFLAKQVQMQLRKRFRAA